jgi:hypothetical protein
MRLISARRDADVVDRAPKAIAGMRVIVAEVGGSPAGSGADEYQSQMGLKEVREAVHGGAHRVNQRVEWVSEAYSIVPEKTDSVQQNSIGNDASKAVGYASALRATSYPRLPNNSTLKVSDDVIVDSNVELHEIKQHEHGFY